MLQDFIFSVNSVFPIFIVIGLGYFMRVKGFNDEKTIKKMNGIVFNFAVPLLLFRDIYNSDFSVSVDLKLICYAVLTTLLCFGVLWFFADKLIKDKKAVGAFVQGCYRGNYAIIGMSLVSSIIGSNMSGKSALITTFVIPLYNVLAVIVLTCTAENLEGGGQIKKAILNICKNPLILGILAGVPFSLLNIKLPRAIISSINYMAQLATPLALIAIGGSINLKALKESFKLSMTATIIKLVIIPSLFLTLAYLIGLKSGEQMIILYVLYASPTAVNSYIMAANMGSDEKLASNIILMTTIFSVFTFTIGVYIFKCIGIL